MEQELIKFLENEDLKEIFKQLNITDHKDFFKVFAEKRQQYAGTPKEEVYDLIQQTVAVLVEVAPRNFAEELHII